METPVLLSSHRRYHTDNNWQYLRLAEGVGSISFEPISDGQFELVVSDRWPLLVSLPNHRISTAIADEYPPLSPRQSDRNFHFILLTFSKSTRRFPTHGSTWGDQTPSSPS